MKKSLLLIAALLLTKLATAQMVEVRTNPLSYGVGAFNISMETTLPKSSKTTINVRVMRYRGFIKDAAFVGREGGATVDFRRYLGTDASQGLYLGTSTRYIRADQVGYVFFTSSYSYVDPYVSQGALVGYKHKFKNKLTVDVFAGMGQMLYRGGRALDFDYLGPEVIASLSFGYQF